MYNSSPSSLKFMGDRESQRQQTASYYVNKYSRSLATQTVKGNKNQFKLARVRFIGIDWTINLPKLEMELSLS